MENNTQVPESQPTDSRAALILEQAVRDAAPQKDAEAEAIINSEEKVEEVSTEQVQESSAPAESEKSDEIEQKPEEVDDIFVDSLVKGNVDKTKVQKRFDELTRENYELKARLSKLETPKEKESKDQRYSNEQLDKAEMVAIEQNDIKLLAEINRHRLMNERDAWRSELREKEEAPKREAERINREAVEVQKAFEKYGSKDEMPEMYVNSHKELNILDPNSLLVKVAKGLYTKPESAERYKVPGGLHLAVSDAMALILQERLKNKPKNSETELLKRKLTKEASKNIPPSSKSESIAQVVTEGKPKTRKEEFEEEIERRRKGKPS